MGPRTAVCGPMNRSDREKLRARWRDANRPFEENGGNGRITADITAVIPRDPRLCIVSVHAVNHYSEGEGFKPADINTGGLAIALAETFNASVVYNTRRDPVISPWTKRTAADDHIAAIIRTGANDNRPAIVLDLHGVRDNPHFDIAIGTSVQPPNPQQQKLIDLFLPLARRNGLRVAINPPGYRADGQRTVTTRALAATPACLQFEFSRACRAPEGPTRESRALLQTMCAFLRRLER